MLAMADGELHDLERRLIDAAQTHVLGTQFSIDELEPITPEELAEAIPEGLREGVLDACILAALIDGEATTNEVALLDAPLSIGCA